MQKKLAYYIIFFISMLVLYSCSATKTVSDGDRLYLGADIKWRDTLHRKKQPDKKILENGLSSRVRPIPNKRVLGIPIKLLLYNLGRKPTGKGLNYLLRKKWGEPPVLLSQVKQDYTSKVLQSYLEDNGFYHASVSGSIDSVGKKKAKAIYVVHPGIRYYIDSVIFNVDSSALGKQIARTTKKSLLIPGDAYSLDNIKTERERINNDVKNQGYYFFNPDDLIVLIDSTHNGKDELYVQVKDSISPLSTTAFRMNTIKLYPDYNLENDSMMLQHQHGTMYKDLEIIDPNHLFKPFLFDKEIFLRKDSLYRIRNYNITLGRLINLGTFKFVRGIFTPVKDSPLLNLKLLLTPYPKHSLQLSITGDSKSNNFVGTELSITTKNRNWLRAANLLELNLSAGAETQVGGNKLAKNSYNFKAGASVTLPRFYTPFLDFTVKTPYVPRTKVSADYEFYSYPDLYNLKAINLQYGYLWKQSRWIDNTLNTFDISYILPGKTTKSYDSLLNADPALKNSIQKQFILGSNYTITFNNQASNNRFAFYASGNIDASGNLAGLLIKKSADGTRDLFGSSFAQYIRLSADLRNYWHLSRSAQWVNRIFAGYGYSYGNSFSLPYVKQFFIGGSNSVRAFRARALGPGSFQSNENRFLADQAGDIKLELNTELRSKLFSIVNGALFIDAGNIWLMRQDTSKPGSQFHLNTFWKQMAVGAGAGLRFDLSILILRFDLAFPLRKPFLPEGKRWVIKDIDFGSSQWRRDNLILNIAIGYPF